MHLTHKNESRWTRVTHYHSAMNLSVWRKIMFWTIYLWELSLKVKFIKLNCATNQTVPLTGPTSFFFSDIPCLYDGDASVVTGSTIQAHNQVICVDCFVFKTDEIHSVQWHHLNLLPTRIDYFQLFPQCSFLYSTCCVVARYWHWCPESSWSKMMGCVGTRFKSSRLADLLTCFESKSLKPC